MSTVDVTRLKALTLAELNEITGLVLSAADLSDHPERVELVRDMVIYANEADQWDIPRRRGEYVHEIADGLVSNYPTTRTAHHGVIWGSWAARLDEFDQFAKRYDMWVNTDLADLSRTGLGIDVGRALYLAYTHATNQLVTWLIDNQPEDDDYDEEDGTPA